MSLDALRAAVPVAAPDLWVVGGAVRDALLGLTPRELDLVVEGDAVALAPSLGTVVAVHERFGTATVSVNGALMDVASARRETYSAPGALPDVQLGVSMEEDLRRRDFTVNAMALRVEDGAFLAVPDAERDLRSRRLRVLHRRSFADDPTRMLRGVRYAARLGFVMVDNPDPALLATVTSTRAGRELRLALDEPQPRTLEALDAFGLGRALFGEAWSFDATVVERALSLVPTGVTALAASLRGDVADRLTALGFPRAERDAIAAASSTEPVLEPRGAAQLPARRFPEAVAVAGARGDLEAARWWLEEGRHVRPDVTAEELMERGLGGPALGAALDRALDAALDGAPREEQLRRALGEDGTQ